MSIPLYYAMPAAIYRADMHVCAAQLDFCFCKEGTISIPNQIIPNSPIVIHDAYLPERTPHHADVSRIASLSAYGCILDFERPPATWSISFLNELMLSLPTQILFAVPPAYIPYAGNAAAIISASYPVNNWTKFCEKQECIFHKWMLEIIPHKTVIPHEAKSTRTQLISNSMCLCRAGKNKITYCDSLETVLSKLEIAEYYGCIGGIGLYHELEELKSI